MKLAKVLAAKTYETMDGTTMEIVMTLPAQARPQDTFKLFGLTGRIKSYKVSELMPLPMALEYSKQLRQQTNKRIRAEIMH